MSSDQGLPAIAYVISEYPAVAHTYIQREVIGLRKLGLDIKTVTVNATSTSAPMSALDREERKTTWALRPFEKREAVKAWLAGARYPRAIVSLVRHALRETHWTPNVVALQLRHVPEALVLWDWAKRNDIRHLHAHFANNANEVSRLAVFFANQLENQHWRFTFTMHGPTGFFDVTRYLVAPKVESADAIACITHFCKSQLLSIGPNVDWDKLRVSHLGTDIVPIIPVRPSVVHKILCVGRLVDKKGQKVLIQAISELKKRNYDLTCTIVGGGPLNDELYKMVRELGLQDAVNLTGPLDQDAVVEELRDADIFCMPSFSEGLPVAVMEAMSWQLPVITTDIAGVPELITNGVDGVLVTPSDEKNLVDAIAELVDDSDLRMKIATNGRKRIEDYFNAEMAAQRMKEFFAYCY